MSVEKEGGYDGDGDFGAEVIRKVHVLVELALNLVAIFLK